MASFAVVSLLVLVAVGCGPAPLPSGSATADGITLPVHRDSPDSMLAEIQGVLVVRGKCLFIDTGGGHLALPIWPRDTRFVAGHVIRNEGEVGTVGAPLKLVGGFVPLETLQRVVVGEIPSECAVPDYFVVGGNAGPCTPTLGPDGLGNVWLACSEG